MGIKKVVSNVLLGCALVGATGSIVAIDSVANQSAVTVKAATVTFATINGNRVDTFPIYIFERTATYDQDMNLQGDYSYGAAVKVINSLNDINGNIRYDYVIVDPFFINETAYGWSNTNYPRTVKNWGSVTVAKQTINTDTTAPVINGATKDYYVNVDKGAALSEILTGIYVEDDTDGRINYTIKTDNYTSNKNKIGTYSVVLTATDNAGNVATLNINIHVTDVTIPEISGINNYDSNMSSPITEATIRAGLSASDNVDNNLEIKLKQDNFTGKEQVKGTYTIVYYATDATGNTSNDYVVTVTVKDDIKPTIGGITEIDVASTAVVTSDFIISKLTAHDNHDTGLTIVLVEDKYTENKTKVGTYTMTFKTTDSSGNVSDIYTVNVLVTDDIPPVFYVPGAFIGVDASIHLTHEEIIEIISAQYGIDTTQVVGYKVIEDDYTTAYAVNGEHSVTFQLRMSDGSIKQLSSVIEVVGEETSDVIVEDKVEEKGFWEKVGDFFMNLWEKICSWFKGLFKKD